MINRQTAGFAFVLSLLMTLTAYCAEANPADTVSKGEVVRIIRAANDHWQNSNPPQAWSFWNIAAYHTGNMEAYDVTRDRRYRAYSETWAEHNRWTGAKSNDKSKWRYGYGETDEYVLFGDWQICFQTYADLYNLDPADFKIARAREVMEYQMSTPRNDYWWWADGLYMVMPVMTKLYKITGNRLYIEKLRQYLAHADSIMYDSDASLYYRDAKYVWPRHKSAGGHKDFWARGDGWVYAGLAKVLIDLPKDDKYRPWFEQRFRDMSRAVANSQQPGGYWTRSMLDPAHAPGPETSGTAFFTYGLLWGINNGLIDKAEYLAPALNGWKYLSTKALQPGGRVGYVQPIGERAIPGQVVDSMSTSAFGVGAFLLAASEMSRYCDNRDGWKLVWCDEFDVEGKPDPASWSHENGFVRNRELQWYQADNAACNDGVLVIEGRKERVKNPNYDSSSSNWGRRREYAEYTSSSIKTRGKREFLYGRFEVRAKIPVAGGSWPAIWTLGNSMEWPSCGEIDIMEYYRIKGVPHILANAAWGKDNPGEAHWDTGAIPFSHFIDKDPAWAEKFHVWRMDWDSSAIRLYLDDELLNETDLSMTVNGARGNYTNPFRQPHYLLLNLAIGGDNGGTPDDPAFPLRYEVDYVRVYQKNENN